MPDAPWTAALLKWNRTSLRPSAVAVVALFFFVTWALPVCANETATGNTSQPHSAAEPAETSMEDDTGEQETAERAAEAKRYRFLPIPIFITEPAIGEGLGVALALFHPVKQGKAFDAQVATPESIHEMSESREAPPVVTAVAGAYTRNDTWFAGIGHFNNWRNDSIRYGGGLSAARINSQIYLANLPLKFSMEARLVFQELKFRIGQSDFMIGGGLMYLDADNRFGLRPPGDGGDDRFGLEFKDVGLEIKGVYETRNNTMNPTAGLLAELGLWRYDQAIGGDFDYWNWKARALYFHPLSENLTLGLRFDLSGVSGTPPFYAYPFVKLRGIPALRYQDELAGATEVEARYLLAPRWEVSAFAGLGYTSDRIELFDNPDSIYNFGIGGRYKIFEAHNVWMGIDVARGPEAWNWYIQVGHPW
jgi:hypothetical protein